MLIVLVGPTGSGKTSLAIKLADFYSAPIINADAFQIYEGMDIGTAKVDKNSKDYEKHYLLDIVKPDQTYSVKQYQEDFRKTYNKLKEQYPTIIVCGGTGLYIKAALYDYAFEDEENADCSDLEEMSNEELYDLLKSLDEKALETIHINNRKRVIRAIQIARTHQVNKSESIDSQEHKLIVDDEVRFYFINPNREELYERINQRVDQMISQGLEQEVKSLLAQGYTKDSPAMKAIGYQEWFQYSNKEQIIQEIKHHTRKYAKKQYTYIRDIPNSIIIPFKNPAEDLNKVCSIIKERLFGQAR